MLADALAAWYDATMAAVAAERATGSSGSSPGAAAEKDLPSAEDGFLSREEFFLLWRVLYACVHHEGSRFPEQEADEHAAAEWTKRVQDGASVLDKAGFERLLVELAEESLPTSDETARAEFLQELLSRSGAHKRGGLLWVSRASFDPSDADTALVIAASADSDMLSMSDGGYTSGWSEGDGPNSLRSSRSRTPSAFASADYSSRTESRVLTTRGSSTTPHAPRPSCRVLRRSKRWKCRSQSNRQKRRVVTSDAVLMSR